MATRELHSHVDRFAGLSDRSIASQNTRIESPNLLNVDFSERTLSVRPGYSTVAGPFKDCAVLLDGYNDFGRILNLQYANTDKFAWATELKLMQFPTAACTIMARGTGGGASQYVKISYDPTLNGNLGGWVFNAYDATAAAYRTLNLSDGDAARSQIGAPRHIEVYCSSGTTYTVCIRDGAGTEIASGTTTIGSFVTSSLDFWLGCDPTSGTAPPAAGNTSYAPVSFSGMRFYKGNSATIISEVQVTGRELRKCTGELDTATEYFPMTEGVGNVSSSTATNTAGAKVHWGGNAPQWTYTSGEYLGQSALRFFGEEGEIIWSLASGATDLIFKSTATGYRKWLVNLVFRPELAPGETNFRDRTLIWWGTSTTVPAPLGIQLISNQIVVTYRDGSATNTLTVATSLLSYASKMIRVNVTYNSSNTMMVTVHPEGVTANFPSVTATVNNSDPSSTSDNVCVGRLCTSFTYPYTFNDQAFLGVIDDVLVWKDYYAGTGNGPFVLPPTSLNPMMHPLTIADIQSGSAPATPSSQIQLISGMRLDDGEGDSPVTIGSQTSTAAIFPQRDDGLWWTPGYITVEDPPEIDLIADFSRVGSRGELISETLVLCGGGLWGVNQSTGAIVERGFIPKGIGKASFAQYSSVAYVARRNGYRPFRLDGIACYPIGLRAPVIAATLGQTTGGSLTLLATYRVYYTFRNPLTGVESNPSPVASITLTGSNNAITVTVAQRSAERQCGQRRFYVTAAAAVAGSTAYLSATVEENRSTSGSPMITITAVGTTPTMEYTSNQEPPASSLVRVYKDCLWVAGDPRFPTRAYFSGIGDLEEYNQSTDYLDFDLNSGDPIIGLATIIGRLVVMLRDGRATVVATGDTDVPFALFESSRTTGAVAHNAILEVDQPTQAFDDKQGLIFAIADDKIYKWDGSGTSNITSPDDYSLPSIEYTFREKLNRVYSHLWTVCANPLRRQILFGVSSSNSTRVDNILVYDQAQGIWTRWQIDAEFLATVDDSSNVPSAMFGSHGYLRKIGGGNTDAPFGGQITPTARTGNYQFTFTAGSVSITDGMLNGSHIRYYDSSAAAWFRFRVIYNSTTSIYLDPAGDSLPSGAVTNDFAYSGYIPWYADFVADFGSVLTLKRMRWIKLAFDYYADCGSGSFGVALGYGSTKRIANFTASFEKSISFTTQLSPWRAKHQLILGGNAEVFILRIGGSPTGLAAIASDNYAPVSNCTLSGNNRQMTIFISEFDLEAEQLEAR